MFCCGCKGNMQISVVLWVFGINCTTDEEEESRGDGGRGEDRTRGVWREAARSQDSARAITASWPIKRAGE